ncbi:MAG: ribosome biogenesis GTP-binding protein YihA/YsxC [Pyrinomonadaceae bacterium]|nr:ribosome biogenesis GTP-binding protein YihA/YsxC [Pyrinomonadaceae bacterium]MCX7638896.1 ribosome biogenesis GTP-binding protein YihA/YsxC [Pyrinomonadaceae bacterium]MDW8304967.1 ribosome biogenesis GTP-binding protein YihA/YsxC [Acidobacteriota bacterium]
MVFAVFVRSAFGKKDWLNDEKPEIAFLGRSNVGKSSLINSLTGKKGLARTSNTPGRTQSINFFLVNNELYFVDLPGYGFAKVSKKMRDLWGRIAEEYLLERSQLKLSVHLVDARHEPSELDKKLNEWLIFHQKPHIIVATKVDKISKNQLQKSLLNVQRAFPESKIIPYSSFTGEGKSLVWQEINLAVRR